MEQPDIVVRRKSRLAPTYVQIKEGRYIVFSRITTDYYRNPCTPKSLRCVFTAVFGGVWEKKNVFGSSGRWRGECGDGTLGRCNIILILPSWWGMGGGEQTI